MLYQTHEIYLYVIYVFYLILNLSGTNFYWSKIWPHLMQGKGVQFDQFRFLSARPRYRISICLAQPLGLRRSRLIFGENMYSLMPLTPNPPPPPTPLPSTFSLSFFFLLSLFWWQQVRNLGGADLHWMQVEIVWPVSRADWIQVGLHCVECGPTAVNPTHF